MLPFKALLPDSSSTLRAFQLLIFAYTAQSSVSAGPLALTPPTGNVMVNFNSLTSNGNILQQLNNAFTAAGYGPIVVSVTGAVPGNNYNGDGHVVGPGGNSLTLGSIDGGNFIMTGNGSDRITMVFSQPINGITFDMQIFPEVHNTPDFTFRAWENADDKNPIPLAGQTYFVGVVPSGANLYSPVNSSTPEPYKQLLAFGLNYTFPNGATKLEFIDWPPTIGVDNLNFQLEPLAMPEPASIFLVGGLVGASVFTWIRRRKPQMRTNG